MEYLVALLPHIEGFGSWTYLFILLITILESTAFIGLIIPGTTVIVFSGFLASQGIIDLGDVIWFVALGGIIGDTISFYLGQRGIHLFNKKNRFFTPELLKKAESYFEKHGNKSVALARFIGPIRPLVPFIAGLSKMNIGMFFLFNILGGLIAAAIYVLIGYFFGAVWEEVRFWVHRFEGGLILVIGVLIVGYFLHQRFFKKYPN